MKIFKNEKKKKIKYLKFNINNNNIILYFINKNNLLLFKKKIQGVCEKNLCICDV
jgi:hypothetical protein